MERFEIYHSSINLFFFPYLILNNNCATTALFLLTGKCVFFEQYDSLTPITHNHLPYCFTYEVLEHSFSRKKKCCKNCTEGVAEQIYKTEFFTLQITDRQLRIKDSIRQQEEHGLCVYCVCYFLCKFKTTTQPNVSYSAATEFAHFDVDLSLIRLRGTKHMTSKYSSLPVPVQQNLRPCLPPFIWVHI